MRTFTRRLAQCIAAGALAVDPPAAHADAPYLVKDILPGPALSTIGSLTAVGATAYFSADDGQAAVQLGPGVPRPDRYRWRALPPDEAER